MVVQGNNKNAASEKLQRVRKWSITTYKVRPDSVIVLLVKVLTDQSSSAASLSLSLATQCTRQALAEKLGRGSRTVDLDLEPRLELLKDDRQRYENVTKLAQTLAGQLTQLTVTQKTLADAFGELSVKSPELHVSLKKCYRWNYTCGVRPIILSNRNCSQLSLSGGVWHERRGPEVSVQERRDSVGGH